MKPEPYSNPAASSPLESPETKCQEFRNPQRHVRLCSRTILAMFGMPLCTLVIVMFSPAGALGASIASEGVFDCFPSDLQPIDDKALVCEASAVMSLDDHTLLLATDKNIPNPGYSQVFELPYVQRTDGSIELGKASYRETKAFRDVRKLEAFARGETCAIRNVRLQLASNSGVYGTGPYNTFLFWNSKRPDDVQVAYRVEQGGVVSSLPLREKFTKALVSDKYQTGHHTSR